MWLDTDFSNTLSRAELTAGLSNDPEVCALQCARACCGVWVWCVGGAAGPHGCPIPTAVRSDARALVVCVLFIPKAGEFSAIIMGALLEKERDMFHLHHTLVRVEMSWEELKDLLAERG